MNKGLREEARLKGWIRYTTGKPCPKGHLAERFVSNGTCVECLEDERQRDASIPEKLAKKRARNRKWRKDNLELVRSRQRERTRKKLKLPAPTRPCPSHCELCGKGPNGRTAGLTLDHDHVTGVFRGWICNSCNLGLGKLGDNLQGILKALDYLNLVGKM